MRLHRTLPFAFAILLSSACGSGSDGEDPLEDAGRRSDGSSPSVARDAASTVFSIECDGRRDGTSCGPAGSGLHCIIEACVENSCGDGWRAGDEECDDGNFREGDGCTASCRMGERTIDAGSKSDAGASASNGGGMDAATVVDAGSSAAQDAGQTMDTGAASIDSGVANGTLDSGQVDSGALVDSGASFDTGLAGSAAADTGVADSGSTDSGASDSGGPDAAGTDSGADAGDSGAASGNCGACRNANCRTNADGLDVVAGCLEAIHPEINPGEGPQFLADCLNVVTCAQTNNCAYVLPSGPAGCYCGSADPTTCVISGPAADARCRAQWETATRSMQNSVIQGRFTQLEFPAGWAYALLVCDGTFCPDCRQAGAR